ncbi:hypothetical protein FNV43_RR21146 [Rhamnella rubrinervis]|uniref:tRNA uridine(34) hydroxylase N-terminal domain-containing protein n=1 Tax=Rhamnella rubrinervis TaxID=2594499 RepID=A0A8K0GU38_9ROSA|nr:hypothetical protein FNV43_RR21146 [Rhamnella rubrinervis]
MRVFGSVTCGTLSSILTPLLDVNRSDPLLPRFYSATIFTHGHPKPFLFLTQKTISVKTQHGSGGGRGIPLQCCKCGGVVPEDNFVVVNFYRFVFIKDPLAEVAKHLNFLKGFDLKGRIYLNEQGINAQYSGPSKGALAYVEWLKEDERFSDILIQVSPALDGHAFPKLKLRYKPSLVQLEGGITHLPLLDPSIRATPLAPSQWRKTLEALNTIDGPSTENLNANYILLDVRNVTIGSGIASLFCYNVANLILRVTHYLKNVLNIKSPCCMDCVKDLRGCCCMNCTDASRLRPVLDGQQRYKKWHIYRDSELQSKLAAR